MTFKSRFHSWLCIWLSCLLSAILPAAPVMLTLLAEDVRVEESAPTDAGEEMEVGEITLSASSTGQRRQRREQVGIRAALSIKHRLRCGRFATDNTAACLGGQGSLWGRCGPLHC